MTRQARERILKSIQQHETGFYETHVIKSVLLSTDEENRLEHLMDARNFLNTLIRQTVSAIEGPRPKRQIKAK